MLCAIAALSFAFALFLGWFVGAWMILPFAGIEVGCVAAAFWWIERRSADRDVIEIGETAVLLTRRRGKAFEIHRFERVWAQVDISRGGGSECSIRIRQSGREITFGEFLRADELRTALRDIRLAMTQGWQTASSG